MRKNNNKFENSKKDPGTDFKNSEKKDEKDLIGKPKKSKLYKVVFKQNRSFEIWIPTTREQLRFEAHIVNPVLPLNKKGKPKYANGVPKEIINDAQFQSSLKYLNVMEV